MPKPSPTKRSADQPLSTPTAKHRSSYAASNTKNQEKRRARESKRARIEKPQSISVSISRFFKRLFFGTSRHWTIETHAHMYTNVQDTWDHEFTSLRSPGSVERIVQWKYRHIRRLCVSLVTYIASRFRVRNSLRPYHTLACLSRLSFFFSLLPVFPHCQYYSKLRSYVQFICVCLGYTQIRLTWAQFFNSVLIRISNFHLTR